MVIGRKQRGLRELCRLLGYTPQAYYQYERLSGKRLLREELLIQQVLLYRKHQPRIGSRKLLVLLAPFMQAHSVHVGRDSFFELLRSHGLLIRKRGKRPRTTFSMHRFRKYPDMFKTTAVTGIEQVWVSDITYIRVGGGFAYLSLITDVYSRKIVGYALSGELSARGTVAALEMAIAQRSSSQKPLLHHSDRGVQYCSEGYVKLLTNNNIAISMTQSGDPRDNAIAERVNGILKDELLLPVFRTFAEATRGVASAIDVYNHQRPHSSVDMLTPAVAHNCKGELNRRWKSYYKAAAKETV